MFVAAAAAAMLLLVSFARPILCCARTLHNLFDARNKISTEHLQPVGM